MCCCTGSCTGFSPAIQLVRQVTQARDADDTFDAIDITAAATVLQSRTSGRTGPLFREYATAWQAEEGAPIYDEVWFRSPVTTS